MFDEIEGMLGIAVELNNDNVETGLQQLWDIIQFRIGRKLACQVGL